MGRHDRVNLDTTAGEATDADLAYRAGNGDLQAFENLVTRYNQRLFRFARGLMGDSSAAQDVLQEAYLKVFKNIGSFRGPDGFASWIFAIVRNEALTQHRQSARQAQLTNRVSAAAVPELQTVAGPEVTLFRRQIKDITEHCIDSLPDSMRETFILREIESFSVKETANLLGLNEATVKMRTLRAKKLMKSRLGRQFRRADVDVYPFGGSHCKALTGQVMARIRNT